MSLFETIMNGIFTGIGAGFGSAVGMWFYKKYMESRLDNIHEKVINGSESIKKGIDRINEVENNVFNKR